MKSVIKAPLAGKFQRGFTLMELMVVVAIVTIIAAVGYPNYMQYTVRSNRSAAESFLLSVANKQEQYMLDARVYVNDPNAVTTLGLTTPPEVLRNYTVDVAADNAATPPTYTITATPTGGQLANDTKCGRVSLTQTGAKNISGTGPAADCW